MYIIMTVALVAMMGFSIWSQKKRTKQIESMRNSVVVGNRITTIGGIVGEIVSIDDAEFTLETEAGTQLRLKKWAISSKEFVEEPQNPEM